MATWAKAQPLYHGQRMTTCDGFLCAAGLSRYNMIGKIGEGVYGVVYKARDVQTDELVAIKRVSLDENEGVPCTAMREIALLKDAQCDFVVRLLNVVVENNALWLVFEHLDCDLHHLLAASKGGLPLVSVRPLLYQLLLAVHNCHANRVFHRDIKPHNILMKQGGQKAGGRAWTLKLADFGLARVFNLPLRPYTHEVVTLWYRAPEILLGARTYTWAVDMWSVGCLFAEMVMGEPLFTGTSEIDQLLKVFQVMGTPTPAMWPGVDALPDWTPLFPKWRPRVLAEVVEPLRHDPAALDLLAHLLAYVPEERITAREALSHAYFDELDREAFRR